jgi:predicted acyl esterase
MSTAVCVPMRDGAEIAADTWLPPDLETGSAYLC